MFLQSHRMENLAPERIFDELCKLLPLIDVDDLVRYAPILTQVIPELETAVGFDQRSRHHAYDLYTHIAHVTAAVPPQVVLRWAALLHDVGKPTTFTLDEWGNGHFYGHAKESAAMANDILLRLKAPTGLRQQVVRLVELHMNRMEPDRKFLRRWLSRLGSDTMEQLLLLQEADMGSKGTGMAEKTDAFDRIREIIKEIQAENACLNIRSLAVNGSDLLALGFAPGKAVGVCLRQLLEQVLDEQLENERSALLEYAKHFLSQEDKT